MVTVPGLTVVGSGSKGVFIENRTVTLDSFQIAKYATTYELWREVYTWGAKNGYAFANQGREGKEGQEGKLPSSDKHQPVTFVSWRDAIVWCNAYSQMSGLTPVYYHDSACTSKITWLAGEEVYIKSDANGYRLPTQAEWEAAARGGNPDAAAWNLTYAGCEAANLDEYVWYTANSGDTTHEVGLLKPNALGLYDMSGNVWEYVYDWSSTAIQEGVFTNPTGATEGTLKLVLGGACNNKLPQIEVFGTKTFSAGNGSYIHGFRVVRQ